MHCTRTASLNLVYLLCTGHRLFEGTLPFGIEFARVKPCVNVVPVRLSHDENRGKCNMGKEIVEIACKNSRRIPIFFSLLVPLLMTIRTATPARFQPAFQFFRNDTSRLVQEPAHSSAYLELAQAVSPCTHVVAVSC
jgi:hypothetical protein